MLRQREFELLCGEEQQIANRACAPLTTPPGDARGLCAPHETEGFLSNEMSERRRDERVRASIKIDWGMTNECPFQDRITSLSAGGCFLQSSRDAIPGEVIYLRLWDTVEGGGVIQGEIKYQLKLSTGLAAVGFGVEFLNVTDAVRKDLLELVSFCRQSHNA